MSSDRTAMDAVLKAVVVPHLRQTGFRGSMPHFRRERDAQLDLLMFQHFSSGGSFVVEIAKAPTSGLVSYGREIPAAKVNVTHTGALDRLRLGSDPDSRRLDHWFVYGRRMYEMNLPAPSPDHLQAVAQEVVRLLESQAEAWWRAS